jgi:hypothetical protein
MVCGYEWGKTPLTSPWGEVRDSAVRGHGEGYNCIKNAWPLRPLTPAKAGVQLNTPMDTRLHGYERGGGNTYSMLKAVVAMLHRYSLSDQLLISIS